MKDEFRDYLVDILDSIRRIEEFTSGMSSIEFEKDEKTLFAVIRALEVMGEATKAIPDGVKKKHPGIPWKAMAGMRDKLIHQYFGVDVAIVWKTIKEDIPTLKPLFLKLMEEYSG